MFPTKYVGNILHGGGQEIKIAYGKKLHTLEKAAIWKFHLCI